MTSSKPAYRYRPTKPWLEALDQGPDVHVLIHAVPGGFAFQLEDAHVTGSVWYVNASGQPHATVEEALLWALQYPDYPEVAEYTREA